jgi:flagellar assembly protein FliH
MAKSAAVPFHFDLDFGRGSPKREPAPVDHAALDDAYARGEMAGRADAMSSQTAELNASIGRLGAQLAAAEQASALRDLARDDATVQLALAIATKLATAALARFPLAEIERLAADGFAEARNAPHVVARVNDALVDEVKARLQAVAAERGFAGKLIVLGDPEIARGDARLEWADGGMVRSQAALAEAVGDALACYIAAQPEQPA